MARKFLEYGMLQICVFILASLIIVFVDFCFVFLLQTFILNSSHFLLFY